MTTVDGSVALDPESPDDEGAGRLKAQHDAEFSNFTSTSYNTVEGILLAGCRQREMVQDALHEAFLQAREKWSTIRTFERPVGWVIKTARNKILKEQELLRRVAATAPEDLPPVPMPQPDGDVADIWQARDLVDCWLPRLTRRQAEVFRLSRDGFSDHEIAVLLGLADDSVVHYRSAAVCKLRGLAEEAGYRSKKGRRRRGGDHGPR